MQRRVIWMGNKCGWMRWAAAGLTLACVASMGLAQEKAAAKKDEKVVVTGTLATPAPIPVADSTTEGTVTGGGRASACKAVAEPWRGGWRDGEAATLDFEGKLLPDSGEKPLDKDKPEEAQATARMFYVAYFKKDAAAEQRPVTFLYNGGPGGGTA